MIIWLAGVVCFLAGINSLYHPAKPNNSRISVCLAWHMHPHCWGKHQPGALSAALLTNARHEPYLKQAQGWAISPMLVHAMHMPHPAMHRPHPAMHSLVCVSKVTWIGIRLARPPVTLLISFHQLSNAKRRGSPASSSGHQADWRLGLQQAGHIES